MGKIRDAINNIDFQDDSADDEHEIEASPENINTVKVYNYDSMYSYDCENCEFRRYMEALGFYIDASSCWIDCTKEIKEELDSTFKYILSKTYVNNQNAILYTGRLITGKEKLS